jgi:TetR/AcrR family transcriptional regulator
VTTRLGGEERRRQLLAEAVRLFGSAGYEGTSLEAVADAAGVRKQTLLYYFPTKDALFEACLDEVGARVSAALEQALEGDEGGFARAENVIRAIFRLAEEWPQFPSFLREASWRGPTVVSKMAGVLEPLRKRALVYLEKEMAEGTFRRQDPTLLLFTLYTAVVGSVTEAGVLRAVGGGQSGRNALKHREEELIQFLRVALTGK